MSNPYGGGGGYEPYGSDPYRAPEPEQPAMPGRPASPYSRTAIDPVSITGFVLSLLWCTSLVGLILGIIGLSRTKGGVRRGRWAAIAATVIGAIGTLAGLGLVVALTWFGVSTIQLSDAEVGQCTNVDLISGSDDATLFEKDCDEPHDAEVAAVGDFTADSLAAYEEGRPESLCTDLAEPYAGAIDSGDYLLGFVVDQAEVGEPYLCFVADQGGAKLDGPVGDDQ